MSFDFARLLAPPLMLCGGLNWQNGSVHGEERSPRGPRTRLFGALQLDQMAVNHGGGRAATRGWGALAWGRILDAVSST